MCLGACYRRERLLFFFQAEDGIRDADVMEFRRVLFRSDQDRDCAGEGVVAALARLEGELERVADQNVARARDRLVSGSGASLGEQVDDVEVVEVESERGDHQWRDR